MKGIVLAGGAGSRLYPLTKGVSKQLLPVYDKPMIYYPLSILMLAGIREILLITNAEYLESFQRIFGNGDKFGIRLEYAVQSQPRGIPEAFIIGRQFVGHSDVCLILGDNIFWGHGFSTILKRAVEKNTGATIFGYQVKDARRFGVVEIDSDGKAISIEEKPEFPKSPYAVTGLYMYENGVIDIATRLKPSARGELEITDLNQEYLHRNELDVQVLGRGFAWMDTGTIDSLLEAGNFVEAIEKRQGNKIACLEEIAVAKGWVSATDVRDAAKAYGKSGYGDYILEIVGENDSR